MRVLHLSNTPLSNAPDNLVNCLNDAGIDAKLYLNKKSNVNKVFVGGSLWHETPPGILEEDFRAADVIHFHNYAWDLEVFKHHPHLLEVAKKKPALIQYHSPRHSLESFEASISDKSLKHAVIAQYHVRQYPECEFIVPNVIPIHHESYTPLQIKWTEDCPLVSYSPSNTTLKGWDNKGFGITQPILRSIERSAQCAVDVITHTNYADCIMRKRWAHIGIDEVMTGSYHLSALEYLSMGCVTIVHCDKLTRKAIQTITGEEGIPIVDCVASTLQETLTQLLRQGKPKLKEIASQSRAWMETYWNPRTHAQRFEKIYRSL